jgi:hypothetical protein
MNSAGVTRVGEGFWNIRGSFRVGGLIDVGTQVSLVRRSNGKFVFLDAYTLSPEVAEEVRSLTNAGADVEAIINVHPFHTMHVGDMHARYPQARLYGTDRHHEKFPEFPWEEQRSADSQLHSMFAEDFEFTVPRGVDFISDNEHVHFSSVLVLHRASNTLHVDDTINHMKLPSLVRWVASDVTSFHPTLAKALERRPGAAAAFREWAEALIAGHWGDAENLCAAHTSALVGEHNTGDPIRDRLKKALNKAEPTLAAHARKFG